MLNRIKIVDCPCLLGLTLAAIALGAAGCMGNQKSGAIQNPGKSPADRIIEIVMDIPSSPMWYGEIIGFSAHW
jgi:hypothetical protein